MHDLSFSRDIIKAVNDTAKSLNGGDEVRSVHVRLSQLSHVKPDNLTDTFTLLVKETPFSGIKLVIVVSGMDMKCSSCNKVFSITKPTFDCPKCGSKDISIYNNKEFSVESLEIINSYDGTSRHIKYTQ